VDAAIFPPAATIAAASCATRASWLSAHGTSGWANHRFNVPGEYRSNWPPASRRYHATAVLEQRTNISRILGGAREIVVRRPNRASAGDVLTTSR